MFAPLSCGRLLARVWLLDKEKHGLDVAVLKHRRVDSSYAVDVKQLFRTTGKQASAWSVMAAIRSISSFVNPPTSLHHRLHQLLSSIN